jgi:hypothetical protein
MKKFVVLSVNENVKYLYYLPLTYWSWKKIDFEPIVFYNRTEHTERLKNLEQLTHDAINDCRFRPVILKVNGFESETITQVSRLFASCLLDPLGKHSFLKMEPEDYLLTGDIDMCPLSDIWVIREFLNGYHPTVWGRDLTDYHYPICYIGMNASCWHQVMKLESYDYNHEIVKALIGRTDANNPDKTKRWVTDQNLITERINEWNKGKNFNTISTLRYYKMDGAIELIDRGTDKRTGYPKGRVDRSNWRLDHEQLIDAHLPHDILTNDKSFHKVMELLHLNWPKEDFKWVVEYHKQFKKLI